MFSKIEIVPRWIILIIDLSLSVFALFLGKLLREDFILHPHVLSEFSLSIVPVLVVNLIVYRQLRTYSGIIRFTSSEDALHILGATFISTFFLFILNAIVITFFGIAVLNLVSVIIYGLLHFIFLISYRVIIKHFFMYVKNMSLNKVRMLIYGAGESGLATKKAFQQDQTNHKSVVVFVDDDVRKVGKMIDGVNILNGSDLKQVIKRYKIQELVFASYGIPTERKNEVVDLCLAHQIKVLHIPPREAWRHGNVKTGQIQHINIGDLLNRKQIELDIACIQGELKGRTILVTGAAGAIGSEIVRQLLPFETGRIIMCDQSETALHDLTLEVEAHVRAIPFVGDIRDEARMEFLFKLFKPDYIYHAAAYKRVPMMEDHPAEAIKTNVLGTKIIADLAVKYVVIKLVMISTDQAVNPSNMMGASKRIAEIYVQSLNHSKRNLQTKFITTRFGNVLGSSGSVIPRFQQQIQSGGPVTVTHPEVSRYFMTIPDACRLVLEAGCMGSGGDLFVFDMGEPVKINDLATRMIRLAGLVPNQDIEVQFTGLRAGEKLVEALVDDHEAVSQTRHEKIMLGKVGAYEFEDVQEQVFKLIESAYINNNIQLLARIKSLVPEFRRKNQKV